MGEWQPIETAPKDGTPILVARDNGCGFNYHAVWWGGTLAHVWRDEGNNEYPADHFDWWQPIFQPSDTVGDHRRAEEEARSWRAVAERLETEMQDLLAACECEIRDQTHNRGTSDKRSAAYAEGALRVAKGIAARIKAGAAAR